MQLVSETDRWWLFFLLAVSLLSCQPSDRTERSLADIPFRPQAYVLEEPARFVRMAVPEDNPLTKAGVELGKQLFFDPLLSVDSTVSCSSCHLPGRAFTDGTALSRGVKGHLSLRNSPSLINVGYQTNGLFWDGRVQELEELVLHPVQDTNEMGNNWAQLMVRIRNHIEYPVLYRKAFGIDTVAAIDQDLTAKALSQYLRTLVSGKSRYDRYKAGEIALTASEDRGRRIFFDIDDGVPTSECGHCHVEPLFSGLEYFNNGLDEVYSAADFSDAGKGAISGRVGEMGTFRTPSLRNVALTAPYMHDGRFATLEEVIEHYTSGGKYGENVHPNVHTLDLDEQDKADLIAFLNTLTEEAYLNEMTQ